MNERGTVGQHDASCFDVQITNQVFPQLPQHAQDRQGSPTALPGLPGGFRGGLHTVPAITAGCDSLDMVITTMIIYLPALPQWSLAYSSLCDPPGVKTQSHRPGRSHYSLAGCC